MQNLFTRFDRFSADARLADADGLSHLRQHLPVVSGRDAVQENVQHPRRQSAVGSKRLVGWHFDLALFFVPQPGLADTQLAVGQRHHPRLLTVPADGALRLAGMFLPGDFLGGQVQDGLDGRSTGDVDDFIDGSLSGLDQAHNGQKELSLLLKEFSQRPAVFAVRDLVV